MSKVIFKTDKEREIENIRKDIKGLNHPTFGRFIASVDVNRVDNYDQVSEIANCSPFKTCTGELKKPFTLKYYIKGTAITCVMRTHKGKVGIGQSKCHADDTFSFTTGVRIAEMRARIKIAEQIIADNIHG